MEKQYSVRQLKAGWRLLIFAAIIFLPLLAVAMAFGKQPLSFLLSPLGIIIVKGLIITALFVASWIMSKIEKVPLGSYGLPFQKKSGVRLLQGALFGVLSFSSLIGLMLATHTIHITSFSLHSIDALSFASVWAFAFLCVAVSEEFLTRGYALSTLASGIGFWPAAIITSLVFGLVHVNNPGEMFASLLGIAAVGMFLSFTLRRTGTLWFAVGAHMAWNWTEGFIYGTPVSGITAQGHLLNSVFQGNSLLTGGSNGPESSLLTVPIIVLMFVAFHVLFREKKS